MTTAKKLADLLDTHGGLLLLIFFALSISSVSLIFTLWLLPANQAAFQLFSGLVTGFAGSLTTAAQIRRREQQTSETDQPKDSQ
jgi:hypothetical protein